MADESSHAGIEKRLESFYAPEKRPETGGHVGHVLAGSFRHATLLMLRRQRLILAAVVALLPVIIPVATAFFAKSEFTEEGAMVMKTLVELLHIKMLAPLMALFFATMLVGEEVEAQTISLVLTRPASRAAWILGRYLAYLVIPGLILTASLFLTFTACTTLAGFPLNAANIQLVLHYSGVCFAALAAYGALTLWLGAFTRRPIILGVVLMYGWEKVANVVPGVVDFLTIQKYADALLPRLAAQRDRADIQTVLGDFQREVFIVDASKAIFVILAIIAVFLLATLYTIRNREYYAARTAA
jgi:ABC-type transport system involved in multi-copper enzyme maturation permease subunit